MYGPAKQVPGLSPNKALASNPLDDIRNTRNISAVVLNGRLMDSKEHDAMFRQVEAHWKAQ